MRKLMMAVVAVVGLGLTVGCQNRGNELQEKRQDLAEAQREAAQTNAEVQRDLQQGTAEARTDAMEKQQEAQQEVVEEQRELVEARNEQALDEHKAIGGSGAASGMANDKSSGMANAQTEEVKGTIQSASASSITLLIPDKNNQMMRFQANPQTQVMQDDKPMALSDLKPGDEVILEIEKLGRLVNRIVAAPATPLDESMPK